ncbi:hypothetical protein SPRG_09350 [Saprolegnia parasitica CBS 223.65]|uniref:Uncharacterized protein n=1 Tax=Saprolegnia parasitica (strain CBS 223.65) TaxID=695850 RepID=A0A067C4F8_SAPPC|nr:hypothetical protein SPRG_09350 [Saprolegnia parasitica CBS 223.65]KDO25408.1 hypothetical protein SPRG_09350 [Saprolegnia parasitica CBS 223.65]|eukprot:XP_012203836.1 hypothetical protein SPRG_09350 [Saprolegnia parasitica CBS 223.65]
MDASTVGMDGSTTTMQSPGMDDAPMSPIAQANDDPAVEPITKEDEPRVVEPERFEIEPFTPFSSCHLWRLMSSFYERQGVESWAQGIVPHFITSNTFIAKRYVQVFLAYLRDAASALDPTQPLYLIELGTGSGKFSFYFVQWLHEMEAILPFPLKQIRYIMTDFTDANLKFWTTHPALAPYVASGLLDFAIFDATADTSLHLIAAKTTIAAATLANPMCVIANYLFDTLHHELFRVENGILKQGLISVGSSHANEPDILDPEIIKRLANRFQYDAITSAYYGDQVHLNAVLQWYHDYYNASPATFLVPIGALQAIERLKALTRNQLLILSGDKGHTNPDHFRGLQDPHIAVHGSFSVMVNYHAIGVYVASRGGFALHNPQEEASLKVSLFVLPATDAPVTNQGGVALDERCKDRARQYPHAAHTFDDGLVSFGPNDFFMMQKCLKEDAKPPSLKGVLALLKLSFYDADLLYKFRDVLLDQSPTAPPKVKVDVRHCLSQTWKHYYQLDKDKDIAFEIGRVFYGMREYYDALTYYTASLDEMGKHHVTYHNMGLCYYSTQRLEEASKCFLAATELNACYTKAQTWLQRVQTELLGGKVEADPKAVALQAVDIRVVEETPVMDEPVAALLPTVVAPTN